VAGVAESSRDRVVAAPAAVFPAIACDTLAGQTFVNVLVTAAVAMPASGEVPAYCKVAGTEIGTEHDIEVRLPDVWRDRLVQEGGGGFDGRLGRVGATNVPLASGAVQVANNGGHRDPSGAVFLNHPAVVERYAGGAILAAVRFGKAVANAYYGRTPRYSYYEGCSNGGRGALNAAANYAAEFDGVIAGAPTRNLVGLIEGWTRASALSLPSATKLAGVHAAAVALCDRLDGVADGIISNWASCQFDARKDVPASVGLTPAEADAVAALMTDLKLTSGKTIYSGIGFGNMGASVGGYAGLGAGHLRNIVLNESDWSPASFDVDKFYPIIANVIDAKYHFSASTDGLVAFMRAGKKVIAWHGTDDTLLSHRDTIRTWQEVVTAAGPATATANSRLYMATGVNHCGGGPGADSFDMLTPMLDWVEKGAPPGTLTAAKRSPDGSTKFTRPMCQYPAYPKYAGSGDLNRAESFVCVNP
jgi:feruloyl esterase